MKKFIKKNLKTILVAGATAIICISGSVFATIQYQASQVKYKDDKSVEVALNELYDIANNCEGKLLSNSIAFGGIGISFDGFIVGHKYIAVYFSNFWNYKDGESIISGAKDIKVYKNSNLTARDGIDTNTAMLSFTATNSSINVNHAANTENYFGMYFIDISL